MNTKIQSRHTLSNHLRPSPSRRKGIALVLVLAMLVLISGLVISFLVTTRNDLKSSVGYEKSTSTRALAETALNVVIGQIQEATQRAGEAWMSQPGLIRTYSSTGQPVKAYKLYSADQMQISGAFDPAVGGDLPVSGTSWLSQPDLFADMNAPIKTTLLDSSGAPTEHRLFPIIDPRAAELVGGQPVVEGFSFDAAWKSDTSTLPSLAMPVKWLYLLKDGTVTPGVTKPGGGVTIAGVTPDNPPVGRFAFWTDDETAKVNINTASEGTYVDTPLANSFPTAAGVSQKEVNSSYTPDPRYQHEMDLAYFQGRQGEYQRYPGHPSTTSLSPVLWKPIALALNIANPDAPAQRNRILDAIYRITPRVVGEDPTSNYGTGKNFTSKGGTQGIVEQNGTITNGAPGGIMPLDGDRLYANLDEMLFTPKLSGASRGLNQLGINRSAAANVLEKAKFFLTANSRSPEVNSFNKPRISVWPLTIPTGQPNSDTRQTSFDRTIKLCATVGGNASGKRYAFTRSNPNSSTEDFSSRNAELYAYLQGLTGTNIPGFGGNFLSKYGADRNQILTQIFDYIRCTNLTDLTTPATSYTTNNDEIRGQVTPIRVGSTRGFGRIATITQVAVIFRLVNKVPPPPSGPTPPPIYRLEAVVMPQLFSPMAGFPAMAVNMKITFSGLDDLLVNGGKIFDNNIHSTSISGVPGGYGSRYGGVIGPLTTVNQITGNVPKFVPPTGEIAWNNTPGTFTMAGNFTIKIESPDPGGPFGGSAETVQEFQVNFPPVTLNKPNDVRAERVEGTAPNQTIGPTQKPEQGAELLIEGDNFSHPDVARAVVVTGNQSNGDFRLVAGSLNPSNFFAPIQNYALPSQYVLASFRDVAKISEYFNALSSSIGLNNAGLLVSGLAPYRNQNRQSSQPDVPPGVTGTNAVGQLGDWDNAPGLNVDGAMLNKPDEGTTAIPFGGYPYIGHAFNYQEKALADATVFSPNRQIPSAVMFGSLPTGVARSQTGGSLPWQTLLFRPAKSYLPGGTSHPGAAASGNPADHLLLDLFWMPVVEPYPISEPFATAGKVNLNYQIAPFTYISRKTGLHAVLKSVKIPAINPDAKPGGSSTVYSTDYKYGGKDDPVIRRGDGTWPGQEIIVRREIDAANTLRQFDERFTNNKPFISASEICDIPLIPVDLGRSNESSLGTVNAGITASTDASDFDTKLATFWNAHKLTGDNSLERPYAHIYPRVTTKSNTFTVHVRAQRLVTTPQSAAAGTFDSTKDNVLGDFRGSFVIERYLDPNTDSLVKDDGTGNLVPVSDETDQQAFLGPYKFRVLNTKQISQ